MEIYLVRHTTPKVAKGICYGQSDLELAPSFTSEVEILMGQLPSDAQVIYCSPLKRCLSLARRISDHFIVESRLMEMHFGDWEMRPWNDIPTADLEAWMNNYYEVAPPGGESMRQLECRVISFYNELLSSGHQRVMLITHGGVIKVIHGFLNQLKIEEWMTLKVNYGEVLTLTVPGGE